MAHPLPLPLPLPIVEVSSIDEVEALATDGGPRRIIILEAVSLEHALAMLSALRAKGLLGDHHAGGFGDSDAEGSASAGEGFDGLLVSDDDAFYVGFDGAGADHGGDDVVAEGWAIDHLDRLLRASDLGRVLDEMAADTLPRLLKDLTDAATLRELRLLARDVRRIGKEIPGLMGQPPVTLGNYIQNVVNKALQRGGSDRRAWVEERWGRILARVFALCHDYPVSFA
ncbi:unnamed protein product [Miscanthus lutarioriparius]|uniref:Uncharacterized protein n=1 Tax=Miscanthus lutarioriparius TaxID=422564 RepID=A0A811RG06_9POAL|nr:unnamed protein product [Miscanthus lutarioriparius]